MFELKKATRKSVKIKLGITGASGSGKTYSSLLLAKGLVGDWSKIALIDTENGSGSLYSHLGDYKTLEIKNDFLPQTYTKALDYIAQNHPEIECVIIDSVSHAWSAKGGFLDMHNKFGGKFSDWSKVTPIYRQFIQSIVQAPFHTICCLRAKSDYVHDKDDKGRNRIEKIGLKADVKEGFEYELTLSIRVDQNHYCISDKDRTGLFIDPTPFIITEDTGKKIHDWCESGEKIGDMQMVYNHILKLWGDNVSNNKKIEIINRLGVKKSRQYFESDIKQFILDLNEIKEHEEEIANQEQTGELITHEDIPF